MDNDTKVPKNNSELIDEIIPAAKTELEKLLNGNKNFINGVTACNHRDLESLRKQANYQCPKAIILSCSDARVIPALIFDCGFGDLFVVRTAGGTTGLSFDILESLEFPVAKFDTPLMVLMGHDSCGAIKHAKDNLYEGDGKYSSLMHSINCVLEEHFDKHDNEITKSHTRSLKKQIIERSKIIRMAVREQKLSIVAVHFSFETGLVELV